MINSNPVFKTFRQNENDDLVDNDDDDDDDDDDNDVEEEEDGDVNLFQDRQFQYNDQYNDQNK